MESKKERVRYEVKGGRVTGNHRYALPEERERGKLVWMKVRWKMDF